MPESPVRKVTIFVSSPVDVTPERGRVQAVVAKLNREYEGLVWFETVLWEDRFYTADKSFQPQITEAVACDVVISIFWTRIGTELPADFPRMPSGKPYPSGTAYELLTALEASKAKAVPDVYVFRKTADAVLSTADADRRRQAQIQLDAMETFWSEWFKAETGEFKAAFQNFPSTDAFEEQVELLLRQWLETRGLLGPRLAWPKEKGSPFRGLAPFEAEHAAVFFGRARMIDEARRSLVAAKERGTPFLLIVGASGSGKSSLARAGLLPRLTTPGVVASIDVWRVAQMKPSEGGAGPLTALATALFEPRALPELMHGDYPTPAALADNLRRGGEASVQPILRATARVGEAVQRERHADRPIRVALVLLVDQLEELFALGVSDSERSGFAECLKHLVGSSQVWCVATMRADLYELLLKEPGLKTLKETGGGLDLGPPGAAELAEIVRAPAQAAGLVFERDARNGELDERLLADAETADSLPLLQFTLHQLYGRRVEVDGEARLTHAAYDALGGLQGAIAAEAEQAVANLPATSLDTLPRLLRRLAEPARDGNALTLREVPQNEAAADSGEAALVDALLGARILIARRDTDKRPTIRLAHNAVLASWPRAASAAQASRDFYRVRSEVEDAMRRWREHGHPKDRLIPTGVPLAEADKLVQNFGRELPPELTDYVSASRHRARTRQRWLAAAAVFFFLLAIAATGASLMAYRAQQEAVRAEARAIVERDRATRNFEVAQRTAETLVFGIAQGLRNLEGMSAQAVRKVLETASAALEALVTSAPNDLPLQRSRAALLDEFADSYETLGDLAEALKTRRSGVAIMERLAKADPTNDGWQRDLSFLYSKVGDVLIQQGKLDEALASYRNGFNIAERLASADPANTDWQRNLSSSQERIAIVLVEQGKFDEALKAHRDGLAIRERLVAVAPDNTLWQRDLMVSHSRIGDVLMSQGKLDDALAAYRNGRAIVERLAASNPSNTQWQSDLSWSYDWIGNVLMSQGEVEDALKAYRDSLAIRQRLAATDRGNVQWQSDLSGSYGHVGDVLSTQLKYDEALKAYRDSLAVVERLAASDPSNIQRQRDQAWFQGRIGDVLTAQGKLDEALKAYHERLIIRARVVADRSHPGSRNDLAVAYLGVANVLEKQGKLDEALEAYRNSIAIREALAVEAPGNAQWASDLAWSYEKIGDLLKTQGRLEDALKAYRDGAAVRKRLATGVPGNTDRQRDLALSYDKVANVMESLGRLDEALEAYRNGVAIRETLAVENPGDTQRASDLAWSYEKVGDLLKTQGKLEDALKAYRDGAAVKERLAAGDPDNADRQRDLAPWYDKLANVLETLGKFDEALTVYRDGLAIRKRLAGGDRNTTDWQREMAWSHDRIGGVLNAQGRFEDALKAYREGLKIRQVLIATNASDPSLQEVLQSSIGLIGSLAYRFVLAGDFAKGLEAADQAISLAPSMPWLYANRAHALMFLGRLDEARALYLQRRGTKNVVGEKSWDEALMEDFVELRNARLAQPLMDEIEKRLAAGQ